jgi:hypothetical protein
VAVKKPLHRLDSGTIAEIRREVSLLLALGKRRINEHA